uniref:G_PROTEIN_RECEP_F1_2 domain-containing protein n=1 Tax=Schistosoma mansoni TaxID=6183 RepID=A0A5K4FD45_SCHMA
MEACHANISYGLFNTNSNFINDLVNLTKVESEMFSEWRFALNIIIISLQILSGIFIFGGNLLVISAVATTKGLRRITDLYIVSLALADLLVAVLILPHFIMRQVYGYWPYESHELFGFIYIRIFWVIHRRSKEFEFGKFSSNPKEHRFGSFKLLFNANNIYDHSFRHKMNRFSLRNSSKIRLFVTNSTQSNLFVAYTPRTKHKNVEKDTVNKSLVQSTSTSSVNKRSEQIERVYSENSRQHAQFIQMVPIPMFHRTTKSDPSDISSFPIHSNIENTEIHTSQTADTIDKTVDASMNDRLKDQQREDEHRINSQNKRIVDSKPKHSRTHTRMICQRRKRIVYNSEKKTVKTVALVVCCFVLFWLPFTTLYLMEAICECLFSEAIFMGTGWIAYLNSICNPFIYAFCNTKHVNESVHNSLGSDGTECSLEIEVQVDWGRFPLSTIIIFFGNLLIILWIATRNRLKRICDLYIASLALADFLVSVFVLPFAIIRQNLGYWPFESTLLCQFHISSDIFLCMSSILNLCCISIDRYVAISYPLQYITKQSRRISIIMILIAWIIPSFSILPPLFGMSKHVTGVGCCYISYSKEYRIYSSVLAYFLPIILIGRRSKVFNPFNIDSKKQESRTNLSRLIPLLTDHFSKRFIQRNKKLENDISLLHFNNIHNNDIDITDALSYTYHWTNDCIDSKDIYHRNKIDFYFDTSNELEINEPEPVDENLKTLYIFHIPITEHDVIDESYLDESLLNKHTSSSNGCFNGMISKCQYLYKHRNRSSLHNKSNTFDCPCSCSCLLHL